MAPVAVRAIVDTGAGATGVARHLLRTFSLPSQGSKIIRSPVGPPQIADLYWVSLALASGGTVIAFGEALVLAADCFDEGEEYQALIGRDVLDHCIFQYLGPDKTFTFAF